MAVDGDRPDRDDMLSYRDAGVDIDAGDEVVAGIQRLSANVRDPRVVGGLGHFGGFFRIGPAAAGATLVASIDGVGTKIVVASLAGQLDGIGEDIVHHCVNDILACGASPLFFLDYYGTGRLNPDAALQVIGGITRACLRIGVALIGGETAEMPGVYSDDDFDLVGAIVGIVQEDQIIDGSRVQVGDSIVGVPSDGFHTNGYSLIRAALRLNERTDARRRLREPAPFDPQRTLADVLLQPHRSYRQEVSDVLSTGVVHGMAHITGGGIPGNLARIIPDGMVAHVDTRSWTTPAAFEFVAEVGHIARSECFRAFNMGIGYVFVCSQDDVGALTSVIDDALVIGEIVESAATTATDKVVLLGDGGR